jgi:hypothetical protein
MSYKKYLLERKEKMIVSVMKGIAITTGMYVVIGIYLFAITKYFSKKYDKENSKHSDSV